MLWARTAAVLFSGLLGFQEPQTPPKPDISLSESKRIAPFPPKRVTIRYVDGLAIISWSKTTDPKITAYEVFRSVDGEAMKKVCRTEAFSCSDKPPRGKKTKYGVVAIDANDNASRLRIAELEKEKP